MRICYTCDTHGYIYPTNYYEKHLNMDMGLIKLASKFNKDSDTLVIDGGDTLQGSPLTSYLSKSDPLALSQCMNSFQYDYITLGNHDFNYGVEYLHKYLDGLNAMCLCANICDINKKLAVKPYAIHTMPNGLKIGIIGVCTHHVSVWEKPETLQKLSIIKPVDAINQYLPELKANSDITICLYHGGLEIDPSTMQALNTTSDENQGYYIAKNFDFDIVLTAHQHMDFEGYIEGSYVVQNANNARSFVEIHIDGKHISSERIYADNCNVGTSPLQSVYEHVENWLDMPLGTLSTELVAYEPLYNAMHGSLIANFINMVQIWASGADISACSLANEVKGFKPYVTRRDVLSTYVYDNTLCVLSIDGTILKEYMEYVASYFCLIEGKVCISDTFTKPKLAHYNYDYFYNVDYAFDITKPYGNRVVYMRYNGAEILPNQSLSIVVNNYRASATGGFDMLRGVKCHDTQNEVAQLIISMLETYKHIDIDTHINYKLIY